MPNNATNTILKAGFLAGLLDIAAACLQYVIQRGGEPGPMLRFIASGVFGRAALNGGWPMTLAGLLFHFLIAYLFAIFFFIIYKRLGIDRMHKIVAGIVYGIFVWAVMACIVLPLSNTPSKFPFRFVPIIRAMAILIACVGIPISLVIGRYYESRAGRS